MQTLGKVMGLLLMMRGALLLAAPVGFLRFWTRKGMPRWIRDWVSPWLALPTLSLRVVGMNLMLLAALLLGLSRQARQAPSH